jgi:hypothetical protein
VRHLNKLQVNEKPSIKARGKTWWSVSWKDTHIAVQLHPGFEHQVWWGDVAFVAKNNFHLVRFSAATALEDQELVSASLACAFGALSALYLTAEVGCEGVRYATTDHLESWPVLDPQRLLDPTKRLRVLDAYRSFRKREAQKLHSLSPATKAEFLELTEAVADAAGAPDPKKLAGRAVTEACDTTARRARREAAALGGRTPGKGKGVAPLTKRVKSYLASKVGIEGYLEKLTGGDAVLRLRRPRPGFQAMLDLDIEGAILPPSPQEERLAGVIGEGFECAPLLDDLELPDEIESLFKDVIEYFVGPAPEASGTASTYAEVAGEVEAAVRSWLQVETRRRLD